MSSSAAASPARSEAPSEASSSSGAASVVPVAEVSPSEAADLLRCLLRTVAAMQAAVRVVDVEAEAAEKAQAVNGAAGAGQDVIDLTDSEDAMSTPGTVSSRQESVTVRPVPFAKLAQAVIEAQRMSYTMDSVRRIRIGLRQLHLAGLLTLEGDGNIMERRVKLQPGMKMVKFDLERISAAKVDDGDAERRPDLAPLSTSDVDDDEEAPGRLGDSDSEGAKDLPKARVRLHRLTSSQVKGNEKSSQGKAKIAILGGRKVRLGMEKRALTPPPEMDDASTFYGGRNPSRSSRNQNTKYNNDDFMNDLSDLEEEAELSARRTKRRRKEGKKRRERPRYEEDSDFSGGGSRSSSCEEEYDSGSDNSRGRGRARDLVRDLVAEVELLDRIDCSKVRNWSYNARHNAIAERSLGSPGSRVKVYCHWLTFVKFMKQRSSSYNPFKAREEDVASYLELLQETDIKLKEFNQIKAFILRFLGVSDQDEAAIRKIKKIGKERGIMPSSSTKWMRRCQSAVLYPPPQLMMHNYVTHCVRLDVHPFACPLRVAADFYEDNYLRMKCSQNFRGFVIALGGVHREFAGSAESAWRQGMAKSAELKRLNDILECLDKGFLTFAGATKEDEDKLRRLTADFKYEKYLKSGKTEKQFWREKFVFNQLQTVFGNAPHEGFARALCSTADLLGVSPQMLRAHFFRLVVPDGALTDLADEFARDNADNWEVFWQQFHVEDVLERTRKQQISVAEGAFELGAGLAEFKAEVGEVREKVKEPKKPSAPKLNPLEKQIRATEKVGEELSEYEKKRLENIRERLELFNSMDFGSLKAGIKVEKKKAEPKQAVVQREKSRRIRDKQILDRQKNAMGGQQGMNAAVDLRVPYVPELEMLELTSLGTDPQFSKRFLSCLARELGHEEAKPLAEQRPKKAGGKRKGGRGRKATPIKEEVDDDNMLEAADEPMPDHESLPFYELATSSVISAEKISCAVVFPEPEIDLVVCGDCSGALCLWLDGSPRLKVGEAEMERAPQSFSHAGRYCAYHPHSEEITRLDFSAKDRSKVISSSLDGTMRMTDLESQKVSLIYQWNKFVSSPSAKEIYSFEQLTGAGLQNSFLLNTNRDSVVLFDDRCSPNKFDTICKEVSSSFMSSHGHTFAVGKWSSVCLYDLRMVKAESNGDPSEFAKPRSLGAVGFNSPFGEWSGPQQVEFSPGGNRLLVTVKNVAKDGDLALVFDVKANFSDGVLVDFSKERSGWAEVHGCDYHSFNIPTVSWINDHSLLTFSKSKVSMGLPLPYLMASSLSDDGTVTARAASVVADFNAVDRVASGDHLGMAVARAAEVGSPSSAPKVAAFNSDGPGRIAVFRPADRGAANGWVKAD